MESVRRSASRGRQRVRDATGRVGSAVAASACVAGVAFLVYGAGRLNIDTMFSIAWGQQILDGQMPDFTVGPTPHPLANALGLIVAPTGAAAESVVLALGYLSAGLLIYAAALVSYRTFGLLPTAIATAVLALTLPLMLITTTGAYVDIPYAALVVLAVVLELERPRRGTATLAVLAVAGLLRPEAWLLAGAYWLWLAPTLQSKRARIAHTALAALAPILWLGTDLITTGDPFFSFNRTTQATTSVGLPTGASAVADLPRTTSYVVGRLICVAALVGLAAAMRTPRGRLLFAWLVGTAAAGAVPVLAGTPLNTRYFLATFVLLCAFAAYGAFGWWTEESRSWRWVLGIACAVIAALQLAFNIRDLNDARDTRAGMIERRDSAKAALTYEGIPCRPLVVPGQRVRAYAAVWTQTRLDKVLDAHKYQSQGVYLIGTDAAMEDVATTKGRPGTAARPPSRTTIVRSFRGWQLRKWC